LRVQSSNSNEHSHLRIPQASSIKDLATDKDIIEKVVRRLDDEKLDMDSVNRTKKKNKQSILVASG